MMQQHPDEPPLDRLSTSLEDLDRRHKKTTDEHKKHLTAMQNQLTRLTAILEVRLQTYFFSDSHFIGPRRCLQRRASASHSR